MAKNTQLTAEEVHGKPFQKGHDPRRNIKGRPVGALDFKTKFYNVIDKLAKQNDITPDEVEEQIVLVGYKKAKDGDYAFYRDLMDRLHGKPQQHVDITTNTENINKGDIDLDTLAEQMAAKLKEEKI